MSVNPLGPVTELCYAAACKSPSAVSKEMLEKMDSLAEVLYGVRNESIMVDKLGLMKRHAPLKTLDAGFRDVVNAKAFVAGMGESLTKLQFTENLARIERMICLRVYKHIDLIINREEGLSKSQSKARAKKEEVAIRELGPRYLDEVERRRPEILAARAASGGHYERLPAELVSAFLFL